MTLESAIPWLKLSTIICILCFRGWCEVDGYNGLTCLNMTPGRFEEHLNYESLYKLKTSVIVGDKTDNVYLVSILSPPESTFSGFILQALAADQSKKVLDGYFACQPNTKRQNCGPHKNNTLTHVRKKHIHKLVTIWTPPTGFEGKVIFRAYVNADPSPQWMVLEDTVTVNHTEYKSISDEQVSPKFAMGNMEKAEEKCGPKRCCFGMPTGCLRDPGSCQVLVSFAPMRDGVDFQLTGQTSEKVSWLAVGLSDDKKMGDDSVTDCILRDDGKVIVQQSWNYKSPKQNDVLSNPHEGIQNMRGKFENGTLTCSWKRQFSTRIHNINFDLIKSKWHLLLARGPLKHKEKKKHHGALASYKSFNLTSVHQCANGFSEEKISHPNLTGKNNIADKYKNYITAYQEKIEHARMDLFSGAHSLRDAVKLAQRRLQ